MDTTNIPTIMRDADPFFFQGGEIGVLVLHGLAATPSEVRWLGRYLADQGMTVYGPRLAGHGVHPRELRHLRWQDWYLSALDGFHLLKSHRGKVYVVGHSTGGLLGMILAASEPVDGLVALAAPAKPTITRVMNNARYLKYILPYSDQRDRSDFPQRLKIEQRRRGEPDIGRVRYDRWATRAVEELVRLIRTTDTHMRGITAPTLLMNSEADQVVPLANMQYIRERLSSRVIETEVFTQSGHILPQDKDYQAVCERVARFIQVQARS